MRSLYVGALLAAQLGCRWGFGAALGDDEPADARNGDVPIDVPPGTITTFEVAPPAFSTSSTAFVDIPGGTFEIPPSPGTTWLLVTAATLAQPTLTAFGAEARYLVSGVEQGMGGTQGMGAGPWQHFYVFPGMDVPQTVAYQLRDTGGQMASIDHLRIVAMPLPANGVIASSSNAATMQRACAACRSMVARVARDAAFALISTRSGTVGNVSMTSSSVGTVMPLPR